MGLQVQSYKFLPLVYQIASRLGSSKDGQGSISFQVLFLSEAPSHFLTNVRDLLIKVFTPQLALLSLVKKMSIDHPYHTIFQVLET